ncbi:chitin-binding protein [Nakamurella flava]|uniref:Chitin-binding protein n=2 Tax=Nakamurella flava TaxID=2576308 RepID=A0A4U6QB47_9ACTN|nr:chitin-binding protein [Nakamurella flava]
MPPPGPLRGFRPRARAAVGTLAVTVLVGAGLTIAGATPAAAHGYVAGTVVSRAAASQNADRGAVANEPQSLEAPKGFPAAGPADGRLASAGGLFGGVLDQQTATRWWKNPVAAGPLTVTWQYTAAHRTSQWRYYLTKPGWNPNAPLTRSELELIATVPHDGSAASMNPSHTITIPADRSGYQILYAVWDVADTANAFYNTIDLDVGAAGSNPTPATTTTPTTAAPTSEHHHSHPETTSSAPSTSSPATAPATTAPATSAPVTSTPPATSTPSTTAPATTAPATTTTPTTAAPTPTTGAPAAPAWNPFGSYRIGDRVSFEGRVYVCRQSHRGWGDPSWITALALWLPSAP